MPKISSYANITPADSDQLLASDASDSDATKNILVSALKSDVLASPTVTGSATIPTITGETTLDTRTNVTSLNNATALVLETGDTERARIDSSGNVGIGTDSPVRPLHINSPTDTRLKITTDATGLNDSDGFTLSVNSAGEVYFVNSESGAMVFSNNGSERARIDSSGNLLAGSDNTLTLGGASNRWSEVFAGNGTINTSDEREKTEVSIEQKVIDAVDSISVKAFKWNTAIEEKGDGARIHYGVFAQEVKSAFESQGLVAEDFGVLCYDEWDEETDEEGNITKEAGDRYGVRYDELYAMKIAALEARITALEA